jgi:ribosomal protein S27AE
MKEIRGMKIVGEKLSPEEIRTRLRAAIRGQLLIGTKHRFAKKSLKGQLEAFVELEALKAETGHARNRLMEIEHPAKIGFCDLRDFYTPEQKRMVKRYKMAAAKHIGTSRKKCPKCDVKGQVQIWPMPFGKRRLLCSRCGWTDGNIEWISI